MEGCYSGGCCPPKKGLFCRLKDWFKGGSRCCSDYDNYCCEQPKQGLFARCKNWFRKKKDPCCYPTPMYFGSSCTAVAITVGSKAVSAVAARKGDLSSGEWRVASGEWRVVSGEKNVERARAWSVRLR